MRRFYIVRISFAAILLIQTGCSRDQLADNPDVCEDNITYNATIRTIINESCSYTGCHDGAAGIGPGNYTKYDGDLSRDLSNGMVKSRVIDQKDNEVIGMPPNMSTYEESLKDDLTAEELEFFMCWLDSGFPEG